MYNAYKSKSEKYMWKKVQIWEEVFHIGTMKQKNLGKRTMPQDIENFSMIYFPPFTNGSFIFFLTAQLLMKNVFLSGIQSNLFCIAIVQSIPQKRLFIAISCSLSLLDAENMLSIQFATGNLWIFWHWWEQEQGEHCLKLTI